jgi:hypothetical protein
MTTTSNPPVPAGKIRLYCVGIYFYRDLDFHADPAITGESGVAYMSGARLFKEAAAFGLLAHTNAMGHIEMLGYTPKAGDPVRKHPGAPTPNPYIALGKLLTLTETLNAVGQLSQVLQYTVAGKASKPLDENAQFAKTGFSEGSFIRVRLISIYVQG